MLDLNKLEKQLDEVLEKETHESMDEWLNKKRGLKFINPKRQKRYEETQERRVNEAIENIKNLPKDVKLSVYWRLKEIQASNIENGSPTVKEVVDKWDKINKDIDDKLNNITNNDWDSFSKIQMLKRPRSKRLIKSKFRRFIIDVYIKFYSILYKLKLYKPKD